MSLSSALNTAKDAVTGFFDNITDLFSNLSDGAAGVFKSLGLTPSSNVTDTLNALADQEPLSDQDILDINDYLNNGDTASAIAIIEPKSSTNVEDITILMDSLQDTVAGQVTAEVGESLLEEVYEVGDLTDRDTQFKEIPTVEELEAEFASIRRPITEMIVHWTESYTNARLTAKDIDERQSALGDSGIQYHYIIQRNGALQRGADIEKQTQHSKHEQYTIAVAFVGGYNVATQGLTFENDTSSRSINRIQFNTFDQLLRVFYNTYPGGQVLGHNDVDEEHDDPGFDVIEYCFAKFNKQTRYDNPFNQSPFTEDEINSFDPFDQ